MKIRALIALALCVGFGTAHAYELLRVGALAASKPG